MKIIVKTDWLLQIFSMCVREYLCVHVCVCVCLQYGLMQYTNSKLLFFGKAVCVWQNWIIMKHCNAAEMSYPTNLDSLM